jgi:hypothetical protein
MHRTVLRSLAIGMVASLALAGVAAARVSFTPFRFPVGVPAPWVQPADTGWCAFDLYVDFSANNVVGTVLSSPDGSYRVQFTGTQVMTFTDLANGHMGTWQTPAHFVQWYDADGNLIAFYTEGPAIVWGALPPFQDSGLYQYNGALNILAGTFTGSRVDICAALAG